MQHLPHLFSPISLGNVEIKNRIVMPPMHTGFGGSDGSVTQRIIDYYEARARGGTGLIIVEATTPNAIRKYAPNTLGLFDDGQIPAWRDLVQKVHACGAKIATQLLDPGPGGSSLLSGTQLVGPSPIAERDIRELPRELTVNEIEEVINDFAQAARRAREAGLDAVEVHAAHGYAMIGSFLSSSFNKRTDMYGGSLEGRLTFLVDTIKAIRVRVGKDFPIIVRISGDDRVPGGRTLQETQFIAPMIVAAGADALEVSGGTIPTAFWAVVPPAGTPLAPNAAYAEAIKRVVEVPVICVGRINSPRLAEFLLATRKADMASMGRALIADPEMPHKALLGHFEDIVPCVGDNQGCLPDPFGERSTSCLMNPAMGREREMGSLSAIHEPKRVVVVGGGPAGLEAARVAALRGHEVTLLEKEAKLGGQINVASVPPGKQEISQIVKYLSQQVEKAGVRVQFNTVVTPEMVAELKPQVVIVASGAEPVIPKDIPGIRNARVVTAWDVLKGKAALKARNVVIIGGGSVGCETADFLAEPGDNLLTGRTTVTIVEILRRVAVDMAPETRHLMMERLRAKGVNIITSAKVKEILEEGMVISKDGRNETIAKVDHVILALGAKSVDDLSLKLRDKIDEIYVIGDARKPRRAIEAIAEGREIGLKI